MQIDVEIDARTNQINLGFELEHIKTLKDYKAILFSVRAYASMVDLDPELELEDIEEIAEKTLECGKQRFVVQINPDEIEVDI